MLTREEERFIIYWEQNRNSKRRLIWQLAAGLPLAVAMVAAIFITVFSEWYSRAIRIIHLNSGTIVVLIALLLTVIFIVVFTGRHRWDMNEQRYRELLEKKNKEGLFSAANPDENQS
jgi:membrane protein YdbS with pleckstrin-like domain